MLISEALWSLDSILVLRWHTNSIDSILQGFMRAQQRRKQSMDIIMLTMRFMTNIVEGCGDDYKGITERNLANNRPLRQWH